MKVQNIKNVKEFFEVIKQCKGKIELVSSEGDRLNMKSTLTQYVALAEIFSNGDVIKEVELVAYEPEDINKLLSYMLGGKNNS